VANIQERGDGRDHRLGAKRFDSEQWIEAQRDDLKPAVPTGSFAKGWPDAEVRDKGMAQQRSARLAEAQPVAKKRKAAGESLRDRDVGSPISAKAEAPSLQEGMCQFVIACPRGWSAAMGWTLLHALSGLRMGGQARGLSVQCVATSVSTKNGHVTATDHSVMRSCVCDPWTCVTLREIRIC
jgi:hypothetical protein